MFDGEAFYGMSLRTWAEAEQHRLLAADRIRRGDVQGVRDAEYLEDLPFPAPSPS